MIQFLKMVRTGGAVTRYHTVKTHDYESIAQHSWGVAMIAIALMDGKPTKNILLASLYHDLAEQVSGDSPATAKWSNGDLKKALNAIEERFNKSHNIDISLNPEEKLVLKYADTLDMCFYCLEQRRMGNRHVDYVFERGISHLRGLPELKSAERIIQHLLEEYGG